MEANLRSYVQPLRFKPLELKVREFTQHKLSINERPKLKLKVLPSHLKYVYLGNNFTLPMIVSAELTEHQEEQLVIGWTIVDIRSISHSFCMHKIILEGERGRINGQRRLNPIMIEVVRK